jgi:hypothetical protein
MAQTKYSPQEALDRVKLMMKYDTSKTLTENKESVGLINEIAPIIWVVGAAMAAAPLTTIGTWIYNVQGGGDSFSKTQTFLQGCSSLDKNLKPTQSKGEHREAANAIYNAIEGIGTDEDAIRGAIASMKTVADLCAMYKFYNMTYGDLYDDLDGDLDGESFRKYVWSAIAPIVNDAEEDLSNGKDKDVKDKKGGNDGNKKGNSGGYKSCSGTYSFGCKSDIIAKVQGCLGLVSDGKFGPKTKSALSGKGFTTFTDADVDKICKKQDTETKLTSDVETQSLGGDQSGSSTSQSSDQESNTKTGIS